jgi:hypothetical protein
MDASQTTVTKLSVKYNIRTTKSVLCAVIHVNASETDR